MTKARVGHLRVAVSGIPRGYHFPRPDGNWLTEQHRARIQALSPAVELVEVPANAVNTADLTGCEVVMAEGGNRTHYPGELDWPDYQRFFVPSLKWVQLCSTGFSDNITPEVLAGTVTLTNAPGLHTVPIAESVLASMLDHAKNLRQRRLDQADHNWRQIHNSELSGRTVLLVGLGRIGQAVARLAQAFSMRVIGTKRRVEPVPGVDLVFPVSELSRYLPEADFVVVTTPLTPATEHLLDDAALRRLSPKAYLINIARGRVVDEAALVAALREQRIAGAYLDAFAEEPLPAEHPFWTLDNVLLVPHDSHSSPYIGDRMVEIFCANLKRYLAGEPLQNVCDPRRGY